MKFENLKQLALIFVLVSACAKVENKHKLPVLGRPEIVERQENGQTVFDTIPHQIADFAFVDQDSALITNGTFADQVYVADFFFTSCPTICPIMKRSMLRIYDTYKDSTEVALLSHTIDPEYDTVSLLREYAENLGVETSKWHFVTGDQDEIYEIGEQSYLSIMAEDEDAPGGYIHSGALILIDKDRRIRAVVDGTVDEQVDLLIKDIGRLLNEYEN